MSLSIQTNVASLEAQNFIRINNNFQNNTIQQLSSGYRINQSGDDAAGLAVANQYAGDIATLTQGVLNANNAVNTLQVADGGISNISTILNRLQTLATESASSTFAGNRTTVNNEYQGLLTEINRQAASINLNTGGTYNTNLVTYVGGGNTQPNSQVSVNLTGTSNAVDTAALGLATSSVAGGGTSLTNNTILLSDTATQFLSGGSQVLSFNIGTATGNQAVTATLAGTDAGGTSLSGQQVVDDLNTKLNSYGISAAIGTNGQLQLSGSAAFTVVAAAASGGNAAVVGTGLFSTTSSGFNQGDYSTGSDKGTAGAFADFTGAATETAIFQNASGSTSVTLTAANASTVGNAISALNSKLSGTGIVAVQAANGTDISFQSATSFNVNDTAYTVDTGGALFGGTGAITVAPPSASASATGNSISALASISTAINNLGLTQGIVGAGENKLNYAINLAQSQITNFSAAESGIRDADVAQEAANLTKAQVLQQASLAALAQANSAPQAVLSLLKG
jgi:flagellin